ncbi:MAG: TetR/AcrR family transcriptional regulator, partial [Myxococcales bacterium]|nr:TetR/AcrR family transcriptional regulator [Myxococcales bacterium]
MKRPRGRPREYDPEEALDAAMGVFWARGYAATSLTDLSEATGMNRPSLYAAFGDKRSVFLRALHRYSARMAREVGQALAADDLSEALFDFYARMIDVFLAGEPGHRGCMVATSASVEAPADAEIKEIVRGSVDRLDAALGDRFRRAADEGLLAGEEARSRGRLATAVLHSLSVRARAGQSR